MTGNQADWKGNGTRGEVGRATTELPSHKCLQNRVLVIQRHTPTNKTISSNRQALVSFKSRERGEG